MIFKEPVRTAQLVLYGKIMAVRSEGSTKYRITLCGYSNSLRDGRSGDRIPVGGEIFRTRPDLAWGPPSLLYNGYRVISGGQSGRGVELTTHSHLAPRLKKE